MAGAPENEGKIVYERIFLRRGRGGEGGEEASGVEGYVKEDAVTLFISLMQHRCCWNKQCLVWFNWFDQLLTVSYQILFLFVLFTGLVPVVIEGSFFCMEMRSSWPKSRPKHKWVLLHTGMKPTETSIALYTLKWNYLVLHALTCRLNAKFVQCCFGISHA